MIIRMKTNEFPHFRLFPNAPKINPSVHRNGVKRDHSDSADPGALAAGTDWLLLIARCNLELLTQGADERSPISRRSTMNVLVLYQSRSGHTRDAAEAIAQAARDLNYEAVVKSVIEVRKADIENADVL